MSAVGVASPSAHGQAMMSTLIPMPKAWTIGVPVSAHARATMMASTTTVGTNLDVMRSTSFLTRGLRACACSVSTALCDSWVWALTDTASTSSRASVLMVPPVTVSSGLITTGIGSPLIMLVSTAAVPVSNLPSAGILSPGRTTKVSPCAVR